MDDENTGVFIHSVKVPRLYKTAAKIVQEVAEGGGSVKQLVFSKKHFNVNALYALVSMTLQKVHEINFLFKRTQLLQKESRLDPWLARLLVTELLWGKKTLPQIACKPIQTVSGYEQVFKSHLSDNSGLLAEDTQEATYKKKPRYVRINTILITFEEALDHFVQDGWILDEDYDKNDYEEFLQHVKNLQGDYFMIDMHVSNLLIFPSGTKFFDHVGYRNGWVILQDKASCLPVHVLNPPPGSRVLDMCAAPGMKTTQLASVLNNQGQIYAVERDERRYESLVKMVESSGATNIQTFNKDILQCSPEDFPGVEYILVDPSCSGSGMTDRIRFQEEQSMARLEKLSGFQIKILRSAITKYPKVKRVVYSTCSVHPEENEDVVKQVLETNYLFKLVDARTIINKSWLNFGSSDFGKLGEYCLYAKPDQDLTNGFFVAVFERLPEGQKNQFFDTKLFNYKKRKEEKSKLREARFLERQKEFEKLYGPVGIRVNDTQHEFKNNEPESLVGEDAKNIKATIHVNSEENNDAVSNKQTKPKKKKRKHKDSETHEEKGDNIVYSEKEHKDESTYIKIENTESYENDAKHKKKKKEKSKHFETRQPKQEANNIDESRNIVKKKRKTDSEETQSKTIIEDLAVDLIGHKKKKTDGKCSESNSLIMSVENTEINFISKKTKKSKKYKTINLNEDEDNKSVDIDVPIVAIENESSKKKRQKKKHSDIDK